MVNANTNMTIDFILLRNKLKYHNYTTLRKQCEN